ncbi:5'-nucleotidase C-terminal domain-containing protein [Brevibacterium album]|uniref:5'-nucleotidase C-terminal domain-containing protein n=1 Tax=Brevibacterium album TaxID=417948 RepID=UPI00041DD4A3|nr:5'-nucleotidase C-terminal domain-containing protein [Brevibacterium album]
MPYLRIPAALAAAVLVGLPATSAAALPAPAPAEPVSLSLLATTDIHGHVLNWDYFTNGPYPAGEELGLARAKTLVDQVRSEKGEDSVLLFDNGDSIQGNPLTSYYSSTEPVTETGAQHPMAVANSLMGYDAQVVGNHEFNYGLDMLDTYAGQVDFPVLVANARVAGSGEPLRDPTAMIEREVNGETVRVGVIGLTTPGSRVWDSRHLDGRVEFADIVATAQEYAPQLKEQGADVVVALSHSGKDPKEQTWDPEKLQENVSRTLAEQVPDIDVVVAGHSHVDEPEEVVTQTDGTRALITQPYYWGRSLNEVELSLVPDADGEGFEVDWEEAAPSVTPHYTQGEMEEDPEMVEAIADHHRTTVDYVNRKVGTATETMSGATSRYEDTAILDFMGMVMTERTREGIAGTEYEDLPVLAQTSPFSRDAVFNAGDVSVADLGGFYIYDNTLAGVTIDGAQLKEYLERAGSFYDQVSEGEDFDPAEVSNAYDPEEGRDRPDYTYDAITGVSYDVNISKPVGERIENLRMDDGAQVADDDEFVLAINNYRQSGGSGYPVADLEEVYNEQVEIRQALIDWTVENQVIDPADFFRESWVLTSESIDRDDEGPSGEPTDPGGDPTGDPTDAPTEGPSERPTDQPDGQPTDEPGGQPGEDGGDGRGDEDGDSRLPRTGTQIAGLAALGLALAGLGAAAVVAARRRRL